MSMARWSLSFRLTDALIFVFLLAITRQFYWLIAHNRLAWVFTVVTAIVIWGSFLRFRTPQQHKTPLQFWLIVALPLIAIYLLRLPFPDLSFDVLNYRLVQSERALFGPPFVVNDFFPVVFPLNPAPDLVTGLFRHFLGYRAGTVLNVLIILWVGLILDKFLRSVVQSNSLRSLVVLLILLTEQMLFQLNTYMVDLLALPLLLEACLLIGRYHESDRETVDLVLISALLGVSLAIKLSNAPVVVPLILLFAFQALTRRWPIRRMIVRALIGTGIFLLPMLPHMVYLYRLTGSPVFPLYNKIFRSAYWPIVNPGDGRWGPHSLVEMIGWPVLTFFHPQRISELGLYSGRLTLCLLSALCCLFAPRIDRSMKGAAFVVLLGLFLWTVSSGYIRYALIFEVLGGVLFVYVIKWMLATSAKTSRKILTAGACLLTAVLVTQVSVALFYFYMSGWSGRRNAIDYPEEYLSEARYLFHDHDLSKFLVPETKVLFQDVDVWMVTSVKSSGPEILLRDVPMIGVHNWEYFDGPKARKQFAQTIRSIGNKNIYSLALPEDTEAAYISIRRRGLQVSNPVPVSIPFYSANTIVPIVMFRVRPRPIPPKPGSPVTTVAKDPLPFEEMNAEITVAESASTLKVGEIATIQVNVTNASGVVWPAGGKDDGSLFIRVADTWFDDADVLVNNLDGRAFLPFDLWPGDTVQIPLRIRAPQKAGEYILEIDLVQEGVAFFKDKGSKVFRMKIKLE